MKMTENVIKLFLKTAPGQKITKRFTAGETLEEGIKRVKKLHKEGYKATLAYLGGEHLTKSYDIERTIRMHKWILDKVSELPFPCDIAIKLSEFGLLLKPSQHYFVWLKYLLQEANEKKIFVWIDAEELKFRETTLRIISNIPQDYYKTLGLCIQAYAHDSLFFLKRVLDMGLSVRVCKGAYKENNEKIFTKDQLQNNFYLILYAASQARIPRIQIATHDNFLRWMAKNMHPTRKPLKRGGSEFGSLLGRQKEKGDNVYVGFGPQKDDFLVRRFMEKPWLCFSMIFKK